MASSPDALRADAHRDRVARGDGLRLHHLQPHREQLRRCVARRARARPGRAGAGLRRPPRPPRPARGAGLRRRVRRGRPRRHRRDPRCGRRALRHLDHVARGGPPRGGGRPELRHQHRDAPRHRRRHRAARAPVRRRLPARPRSAGVDDPPRHRLREPHLPPQPDRHHALGRRDRRGHRPRRVDAARGWCSTRPTATWAARSRSRSRRVARRRSSACRRCRRPTASPASASAGR